LSSNYGAWVCNEHSFVLCHLQPIITYE
jgi:hypothetical protein